MNRIANHSAVRGSTSARGILCWIGIALLTTSMPCLAQSSAQGVDLRYDTLLKREDRNKTTPGNEFGDQHGIESGSLSFNVVDVHIPGNSGLAVEFRRSLVVTDSLKKITSFSYTYPGTRLGDWAIALPKIQGTFDAQVGWITSEATRPTKNCSLTRRWDMAPPPGKQYPDAFRPHMFWNPPTIHYPDGSTGLLVYSTGTMPVPSTGGPYFWVTTTHDAVSCIATLKNKNDGLPANAQERIYGQGEGYLVIRPDGTKYWFDWMALESNLPSVSSAVDPCARADFHGCYPGTMEVVMNQATLALYPTRVEDRFGNWVKYTYSNASNQAVKLDRIESNDGRIITIGYVNGFVASVTAHGRTWSYGYDGMGAGFDMLVASQLVEVRNPDQSTWRYSGVSHPHPPTHIPYPCANLSWMQTVNPDATTAGDTEFSGYTVESPSGARAVFRIGTVMLGRSAVRDGCYLPGAAAAGQQQHLVPRRFLGGYRLALTGKKVTGPGLQPAIWKYGYQSDIGFHPMPNGTTRTKVLGPDGALDTYTFGNTYLVDEGLLLSHTRAANATQPPLLRETHAYMTGTTVPPGFPKLIGYHPDTSERIAGTFLRPKLSTTTVVQSTQFRWAVDSGCPESGTGPCLDPLGRPTRITKSSSAAP